MTQSAATHGSGHQPHSGTQIVSRRWLSEKVSRKEYCMDKKSKAVSDNPRATRENATKEKGKFDKPLGSSAHDEADLRDVARKAAKKSQ